MVRATWRTPSQRVDSPGWPPGLPAKAGPAATHQNSPVLQPGGACDGYHPGVTRPEGGFACAAPVPPGLSSSHPRSWLCSPPPGSATGWPRLARLRAVSPAVSLGGPRSSPDPRTPGRRPQKVHCMTGSWPDIREVGGLGLGVWRGPPQGYPSCRHRNGFPGAHRGVRGNAYQWNRTAGGGGEFRGNGGWKAPSPHRPRPRRHWVCAGKPHIRPRHPRVVPVTSPPWLQNRAVLVGGCWTRLGRQAWGPSRRVPPLAGSSCSTASTDDRSSPGWLVGCRANPGEAGAERYPLLTSAFLLVAVSHGGVPHSGDVGAPAETPPPPQWGEPAGMCTSGVGRVLPPCPVGPCTLSVCLRPCSLLLVLWPTLWCRPLPPPWVPTLVTSH